MVIQERYAPTVVAANTAVDIPGAGVGGFICTASGTITLVAKAAAGKPQTTLINALAVTAGLYYPLPIYLGRNGGTFTTASSGAGLLLT
jgi:hypothetical protein